MADRVADPAAPTGRLDDAAVERRLAELDDLLGQLEAIPGRTAELALAAVETVVEVYGEALCRITERAGTGPAWTDDELLRHLLLLHHIHPDPVQSRIHRAVDDAGRQLRAQGARAELVAVRGDTAVVRVATGSCGACGDSSVAQDVVRDEVLAAAPELARVEFVAPEPALTLIPLAEVRRSP